MNTFYQVAPTLQNQFTSDTLLQEYLRWRLGPKLSAEIWPDLERFGARAAGELSQWAAAAEANPPKHIPYDAWGRRIDELQVDPAWKKLEEVAAEEGLTAIGYERKHGEFSRTYQFAKLYLYHPSSAFFSCPLAMTDGAARAIELYGDEALKKNAFKHLTSWSPTEFWTSGQWMTERTGGSDVSGTSTVAKSLGEGKYELHGTKWFTSATTSQMAMTLARIEGAPAGSRGLSLFYLELRDANGVLNKIEIHRLKDKLGTKALPTAELSLQGTVATLVGGEGDGVKKISSLFNITRMYNATCALGGIRRALTLAKDYSKLRVAFGKPIIEHALHAETLADLEVEFTGNFLLAFQLIYLLGKEETGKASADESAILRLLTPIAKLYTAKSGIEITSEMLEVFGGAGYVEDTGIPKWYRDAQVLAIWEGTTNVLSLDVLRAIEKEKALPPFLADIEQKLANLKQDRLRKCAVVLRGSLQELREYLAVVQKEDADFMQAGARAFAYSLARLYSAALLLEFAESSENEKYTEIATRWCERGLLSLLHTNKGHRQATATILGD